MIKGFLYLNTLAQFFGEPESCKSLIALDMGLSVSNGMSWRGRRTKKAQVFYIAGEGRHGIACRARAWSDDTEGGLDDIFIINTAAQLIDANATKEVQEAIERLWDGESPVFIIIDTLARNFGQGDENSTEHMSLFVANCDSYLREPFHACVVIVHHCGVGDKTRGRGNSALRGAIDTSFIITMKNGVSVMTYYKQKDAAKPAPIAFEVEGVEISGVYDEDGDPVTAPILLSVDVPEDDKKLPQLEVDAITINGIFKELRAEQCRNLLDGGFNPEQSCVSVADIRKRFFADLGEKAKDATKRKRWERAKASFAFTINENGFADSKV